MEFTNTKEYFGDKWAQVSALYEYIAVLIYWGNNMINMDLPAPAYNGGAYNFGPHLRFIPGLDKDLKIEIEWCNKEEEEFAKALAKDLSQMRSTIVGFYWPDGPLEFASYFPAEPTNPKKD
jgi:hypothetical protein